MKRIIACTLVLGVFLAAAAVAQPPILAGVDVFQTSTGAPTFADFSTNPIPADFFCPGSAPFTGRIQLKGVPLSTLPAGAAANGDTIVERLADGIFVGGSASIPVTVRALRLTSVSNFSVVCGDGTKSAWRVDTCLCGSDADQPTTKITVTVDQACGCGHFSGTLELRVCLTFTNVRSGAVAGPITQLITLNIVNVPWCPNPGAGEAVVSPFAVDTDCDGRPDRDLPGTTNFHPGWSCGNQGVDCWTQYANLTSCHPADPGTDHDHCINPICKPRQP